MKFAVLMNMIGNPFMKAILRSPFHPILSKSTALLSIKGRKSGKVYTFPVNYQREGNEVWVISMRDRTWWKNLRGGGQVALRLEGIEYKGEGEVFEECQEVAQQLDPFIRRSPAYGKYLKVGFDSDGNPNLGDLIKAAESRVMIRFKLNR